MDLRQIIADLSEERACLDEVLIGLEKLAHKRTPRRGRPPSWLRPAVMTEPKKLAGLNGATNGRRHPAFDSTLAGARSLTLNCNGS